ncbi:MAG TPA: 16S rRNA (guanine(966)-N(2))-methyltransferase RsmD [Rectinemataceae bacterium]|nr:16S rRNA (guanine(966)-N(2))-methyltransferase RsmD [Rectinemataceae bacterium]
MRITGGKYRGRTVELAHGSLDIRPAMDRMRESLFAVLGDLAGLSFLDLFAGTGILALEAASRGADPVVCVEKDRDKFPVLLRNAGIAEERIECKSMPAERFLLRNRAPFDIVFCDPPFPYRYRGEILRSLAEGPSLKPGGLALMHYPAESPPSLDSEALKIEDERNYGRSHVRFYRKSPI